MPIANNPMNNNQILLSVLIPTLEERKEKFAELLADLNRQRERAGGEVQILAYADNRESTSGYKRQSLLNRAQGRYVCYVDDDDTVSEDYLTELVSAITQYAPDVVTFEIQNGQEHWKLYADTEDSRYRGIMTANHLCAWRIELARTIGWCPYLGYGDDQLWYKAMHLVHNAIREYHIPQVLYHYHFSWTSTANQTLSKIALGRLYGGLGVRVYKVLGGEYLLESNYHRIHNVNSDQFDENERVKTFINSQGQEVTIKDYQLFVEQVGAIRIRG